MMMLGGALLLLAGLPAPVVADRPRAQPRAVQMTIRERVIVKVPMRTPPRQPIEWREKKGPRCIPMGGIRAAAIDEQEHVDFVLTGGTRIRARLEDSCPALDFYSGFYLRPGEDAQLCADRDTIHSRSGGECRITRFRKLVPKARD